jgi:hypothetical protein
MASPEWLEIFRSYSPEALAAQVEELKKQVSVFTSQQVGSKSYTKDLGELRGQLSAAIRIQNERANPGQAGFGITDFSRV